MLSNHAQQLNKKQKPKTTLHRPRTHRSRHRLHGASTIWAEKDKVKDITTAASLWATAAIGLTAGINDYPLAIAVTILVCAILLSKYVLKKSGI